MHRHDSLNSANPKFGIRAQEAVSATPELPRHGSRAHIRHRRPQHQLPCDASPIAAKSVHLRMKTAARWSI